MNMFDQIKNEADGDTVSGGQDTYLKDAGDKCAGKVVEVGTAASLFGQDDVPAVVLQPAELNGEAIEGRLTLNGYRGQLKRELADLQPGDLIAVENKGQVTIASGRYAGKEAWRYEVTVKRPPAEAKNDLPVKEAPASPEPPADDIPF